MCCLFYITCMPLLNNIFPSLQLLLISNRVTSPICPSFSSDKKNHHMRREVDPDLYCPQAALIDEETSRKAQRRLDNYRKRYEAAKRHEKMLVFQQHQRQQRLWMAGGTLVVVALSLFWYKRYSQKGSRRRPGGEGDGDVPKDLVLNEDDGFDGTEEELLQVFNEAAKVARSFPDGMLNQKDQLMVYGLYKQAREGDRSDDNMVSFVWCCCMYALSPQLFTSPYIYY